MATLTGIAKTLQESLEKQMDSPMKLLYGVAMVLIVVYASLIPQSYRTFLDSLLGRVLSIGAIYAVLQTMGWIYGLLTLLAILLIMNGAIRAEGFEVSEKKTVGHKWYVEKVLGEKPRAVATDRVITSAIQSA